MQDIEQIKASLTADLKEQADILAAALEASGGKETTWTEGWRSGMDICQARLASLDQVREITEDQDKLLRRAALEQAAVIELTEIIATDVSELVAGAETPQERLQILQAALEEESQG